MNQILTVILIVALIAGFAYLMLRYEDVIDRPLAWLGEKLIERFGKGKK